MNDAEFTGRCWADLFTSEMAAKRAQFEVTRRAEVYMHAGLPLDQVLDALRISRATWYRRVESAREREEENRAAAGRVTQAELVEDLADRPVVEATAAHCYQDDGCSCDVDACYLDCDFCNG